MVLGFKTKFGSNSPTFFVEKIWSGFLRNPQNYTTEFFPKSGEAYQQLSRTFADKYFECLLNKEMGLAINYQPKIHTIRADTKNRWRVGMPIHFVIKNRTPNRFQFAPILPVKAIQEIEIDWHEAMPIVFIGGEHFYMPIVGIDKGMAQLAKNDGFDSVNDFFAYFNSYFKGKIIHWTDEKYCIDDSSQMNEHAYEEAISGVSDDHPGFD